MIYPIRQRKFFRNKNNLRFVGTSVSSLFARLLSLSVVFLTAACTAAPIRDVTELPAPTPADQAAVLPAPAPGKVAQQRYPVAETRAPAATPARIDEVYLGQGTSIDRQAAKGPPPRMPAGDIVLDFEQADLRDVVRVILGDLLQRNYIVDPDVNGTVTLSTERPLAKASLFSVLEALLATQGATLVNYGDVYRITRATDPGALAGGGIAVAPTALGDGAGFRVYPLRFVGAEEMTKVVGPLLPKGAIVHTDTDRNLLIIAATGPQLRLAANTLKIFDVDQMVGQTVMLTSLENAEARTVAAELERIFATSGKTGGPLGLIQFIPIERLNAVMVITRQQSYLEDARNWLFRLDRRRDPGAQRLFVY